MTALVLDNREHSLAAALTVPFSVRPLDVGDILIESATGEPLLVIERKSHADFAASNSDGRYREQRARLMAVHGSGIAVLYILEGAWSAGETSQYGRTSEGLLKRLTTRLLLRYAMPVLFSSSIADTARWCRILLAQLQDDAEVFKPEGEMATATTAAMSAFTAVLSTAKKGNKTPLGAATAMLSAIPGLSQKRAAGILEQYSVASLAQLSVGEIAALVIGGKRLGDSLARTIHDALNARTT